MPFAVRSRRLVISPLLGAAALRTVWTCPAGRTAVVRTISVQLGGAVDRDVELALRAPSGDYVPIATVLPWPKGTTRLLTDLDVVINPGDSLTIFASGSAENVLRVGAWGSLLAGEPS